MNLMKHQQEIEHRATAAGIAAYWESVRATRERGEGHQLAPAGALVADNIEAVAATVQRWVDAMPTMRPHSIEAHAVHIVAGVGVREAAACALVGMLRLVPAMPTTRAAASSSIGAMLLTEDVLRRAAEVSPSVVKAASAKLTARHDKHRARLLVALARSLGVAGHDAKLRHQVGHGLVECVIRSTRLFTVRAAMRDGSPHVHHLISVRGEVAEWIDRMLADREMHLVRRPVMVVPPLQWTTETDIGGYRFGLLGHVKLYGSRHNSRASAPALLALNSAQSVAWRINRPVYEVARELALSGNPVAGLEAARVDLDTKPEYPGDGASPETLRAWKLSAREWHSARARAVSSAASISATVSEMDTLVERSAFWFPARFDFRTRIYAATSNVSPQGSDFVRGCLAFADGASVGPDGRRWLAISAANHMAVCPTSRAKLDKLPFDARVAWTEANLEAIRRTAEDWRSTFEWWSSADAPFQFLAACREVAASYREGGENHISHVPVSVDGSCNGLQHYAALLRDPVTARHVNLVGGSEPADVYSRVTEAFIALLEASDDERAKRWLASGMIDRALCKRPVMTLAYGVSQFGVSQQIAGVLDERGYDYGRQREVSWLAKTFYEALRRAVPSAMSAMGWMQAAARAIARQGRSVWWTNPIGSRIVQKTTKKVPEAVRLYFMRHPIKVGTLKDGRPSAQAAANSIAPNVIHSFDAAHLGLVVSEMRTTPLMLVHDSFGTLPSCVDRLQRTLRSTLAGMYSEPVWDRLCDELSAQAGDADLPPRPAVGDFDVSSIVGADYAFA